VAVVVAAADSCGYCRNCPPRRAAPRRAAL
jgi:hypothetical protein